MLPYNPEEAKNERKPAKPGIYPFFVEKSEKKVWENKETTSLTLKVDLGEHSVTVFDTMYYTPKALFRIAQFAECCGIDKPTEHTDYEGAQGTANFIVNDKGFLAVRWYETKKVAQVGANKEEAPKDWNSKEEIDEIPF